MQHLTVLLDEAVSALDIKHDGTYVDATFGRGGHAKRILQSLGPRGQLVVFDKDPEAIAVAHQLASEDTRVTVIHAGFCALQEELTKHKIVSVNGILFDFGVSSPQLESQDRGFSFKHNAPLDMRMDPASGLSAREWLARVSELELAKVIKEYGEERFYRKIAHAITKYKQQKAIKTTQELANIIGKVIPFREKQQHPATRTFQAIRIEINHELAEIKTVLPKTADLLKEGGRLVTISFHSLEDRLVKHFIKGSIRFSTLPKWVMLRENDKVVNRLPFIAFGKPIRPSQIEIARNPRARSAIMRVAIRRKEHG